MLPEVLDLSKWWEGRLDYSDKENKHNLVFASYVKTPAAINPESVKPGEIRSYWDLLNPRWTGKIAMKDPTLSGPPLATATFWYAHPALGKEFIRQFFKKQNVAFSEDDRQLLEWLARGRYAIIVAPSEFTATGLKAKGLPLELLGAEQFKEGSYLTAGNGSVALLSRMPHPNAAKVFLNWLLSREGQTLMSQSLGYVSRRLDVPRSHLDPWLVPKERVEYQANYKEDYVRLKAEIVPFLQEILKK
jgi:ABC-type Fe3+ transport system substrate-binding protein